jgi:hypothetical protein
MQLMYGVEEREHDMVDCESQRPSLLCRTCRDLQLHRDLD